MTTFQNEVRLTLCVDNPEVLQQGCQPFHVFDTTGGTIGGVEASWALFDARSQVPFPRCEIRHEEGGFLIVDRDGQITVNQQTRPLGVGTRAMLSEADRLNIGPYRISVHLGDVFVPSPDGDITDVTDGLPETSEEEGDPDWWQAPGRAEFDALAKPPQGLLDPLQALDADSNGSLLDELHLHHRVGTFLAAQADVATTRFEAIYGAPMHAPGESTMLEQDIQPAACQEWLQRQLSSQADPASLAEPLVEGIGATVGAVDGQQTYTLLNEAGRTLGTLIRGLCALNVSATDGPQRISLAGRTLQPIEDNPLRLGLDYPDTVRALFSSERSVVHLSPSAAVEESLEQVRRQQVAVHKAINAGLAALLQAFSPEQLEQRFQRYRHARHDPSQAGDWAWTMYGHYYDELTSGRQQGFDKLFWEVFEQAFDQAVRAEA